ncbi:hypothetical protein ACFQZ4_24915 [Catellatospora coxensis]
MRDDISQQLDGFGADMPATTWASPAEIRGRGSADAACVRWA